MKITGCRWRPLPENETAPKRSTAHKTLIFHSAVGSSSPWGFFARASTVTESHGWTGLDGKSEQFLDDTLRADAQWDANPWAWSWETADNGHPDEFEWTPAQVEELARIAAWFHVHRGVPLRLCRSWDDDGIGYHRQFQQWNHSSHSCPGTVRVKQVPAIIARAIEIVEDDVDPKEVWTGKPVDCIPNIPRAADIKTNPTTQPAYALHDIRQRVSDLQAAHAATSKALTANIAALTKTVALLAKGQTLTAEQITAAAKAGAEAAIAEGVDVDVTFGGAKA